MRGPGDDLADMRVARFLVEQQAEHGRLDRVVAVDAVAFGGIDQRQVLVAVFFGIGQIVDKLAQDVDSGLDAVGVERAAGGHGRIDGLAGDVVA